MDCISLLIIYAIILSWARIISIKDSFKASSTARRTKKLQGSMA